MDLSAETDDELLVYMSMKDEDRAGARAAWQEFYLRHRKYLFSVCKKAYGSRLPDEDGIDCLVIETFIAAYASAGSFRSEDSRDATKMCTRVRKWLGGIANNIFRKIAATGRMPSASEINIEDVSERLYRHLREKKPDSRRSRQVSEAFATLTEREQQVLRVWLLYYDVENRRRHLPDEELAGLAASLGTTSANIRQIRKRALGKLAVLLKEKSS